MRATILTGVTSLLLLSCGRNDREVTPTFKVVDFKYDQSSDHNFRPKSGYADNPVVAVGIAEAVAIGFYGRNQIEKQRPYLVRRMGDRWVIQGSWHHKDGDKGGVFLIELSSLDGKILRMTHGE